MTNLTDGILNALVSWPSRYETETGEIISAARPDDIKKAMVEQGWRNVSQLCEQDFIRAGFRVVSAQYVGGARKTGRFCRVVAL